MSELTESVKYHAMMLLALNRVARRPLANPMISPMHVIPGLTEAEEADGFLRDGDVGMAIDAIHTLGRLGLLAGDMGQAGYVQARLTQPARAKLAAHRASSSGTVGDALRAWADGLGLSGFNGMSEGQVAEAIALSKLLQLT